VNFLLESAKHVRLMQVIRRSDDNCVESFGVEQLVDIGEDVRDFQSLSERTGFGAIIVADRDKLDPAHLREQR